MPHASKEIESRTDTSRIDLSIIIVTWNVKDYALQCLKSLQQQEGALSMETIVVDNASSDGLPASIRREFSQVRLVENDSNLGFAKAHNIGIRLSKGRYICLINPDVAVPPECLSRMHAHMEQNREVGVLSPRMRVRNGQIDRSYMRFPTVWNCLCHALAWDSLFKGSKAFGGTMMTDFKNDRTAEVDVLNGWFWMVRREAMDDVGLLDERFFVYGEDIDWSYRFHQAGWKRVYFAGAEALHFCGRSTANAPIWFYIENQRANIQFWRKHHGRFGALAYLLMVWLYQVVRVLGHGALYYFKGSAYHDAGYKVRRSLACLSWLSRSRPGGA